VIAPAVLIAAGVIGLATSLASARNRRHRETRPYVGPTEHPRDRHPDHPTDHPTDHTAEPGLDDHTKEIR
jgi:hypothetical protein